MLHVVSEFVKGWTITSAITDSFYWSCQCLLQANPSSTRCLLVKLGMTCCLSLQHMSTSIKNRYAWKCPASRYYRHSTYTASAEAGIENLPKNLGRPPLPPHWDKIQKNSSFFRRTSVSVAASFRIISQPNEMLLHRTNFIIYNCIIRNPQKLSKSVEIRLSAH